MSLDFSDANKQLCLISTGGIMAIDATKAAVFNLGSNNNRNELQGQFMKLRDNYITFK